MDNFISNETVDDSIGRRETKIVQTQTTQLSKATVFELNNHKNIVLKSNGVIQIEGDVPPALEIPNNAEVLIISKDQSYLTHGIHKFPAKFFPELPRFLIEKYSRKEETVLDPMCGSGTVILEAILKNRNAIGIDIDPIAKLITKVKITPLKKHQLKKAKWWLETFTKRHSLDETYEPPIPEFHYRDNWFKKFILDELGTIKDGIDRILTDNAFKDFTDADKQNIHAFFTVIFSSIIRDVSNADSHCTRTVIRKKLNKKIERGDAFKNFYNCLSKQVEKKIEFSEIYEKLTHKNVTIPENVDARNTGLERESIPLAITSPPYINAVDYPRTHQLELYWLNIAKGSLSQMKRKYIGTETVYKEEYKSLRRLGYETLDPILEDLYPIDSRRAYIVYKFFEDMKINLMEIKRVLTLNGRYCIAIGNNTIGGRYIPSHEILMEIASKDVGFEIENYFHSGVINHFIKIPRKERMSGEWVIVLRK